MKEGTRFRAGGYAEQARNTEPQKCRVIKQGHEGQILGERFTFCFVLPPDGLE